MSCRFFLSLTRYFRNDIPVTAGIFCKFSVIVILIYFQVCGILLDNLEYRTKKASLFYFAVLKLYSMPAVVCKYCSN